MTTVTVKLTKPLDHNGKTITELKFRELIARDIISSEIAAKNAGDTGRAVAMFASMCDVPYPVLQGLSATDLITVTAEVEPLMGKLPQAATGSQPSP